MKNRVAFITGAGRGIGASTARVLASRGCKVALVAKTHAQVVDQAQRINDEFGAGRAIAIAGDVSDESFVKDALQKTKLALGPVTILVNNAGMLVRSALTDTPLETWNRVMAVNVTGMYLCCKHAVPQMCEAGSGSIVNVSSLSGIRSALKFPGFSAYITSKHAVVGLTEGLSVEMKPYGIRVNCVAPGAVDTQMLKQTDPSLKTRTQPEEIARVIAYLCDDAQARALTGAVIEANTND